MPSVRLPCAAFLTLALGLAGLLGCVPARGNVSLPTTATPVPRAPSSQSAAPSPSPRIEQSHPTGPIPSHQSDTGGLEFYPDEPLTTPPPDPVPVRFLVEHRSALNKSVIRLRGVVVYALLGQAACPPGSTACAEPRVFLAETTDPTRDRNYDVIVLVRPPDTGYRVGETVQVRGTVGSSKVAVGLRVVD